MPDPGNCQIIINTSTCRLPLYYEGTVLFAYFLAHLGGAEYIYATALRTLLLEHEGAIDARAEQARAWLRATFKNNVGWCAPRVCCTT